MPNVLIVFYSRTGTTRRLAAALAQRLDAEVAEIRCDRYGRGLFGFMRAAYDSLKGNLPPVQTSQKVTGDYDLAVLGAPVWTGHPAAPLRAFLGSGPDLPAKVALFLTYGEDSAPEAAVGETAALLPGPLQASLSMNEDDVRDPGLTESVETFAAQLERKAKH